MPSLHLFTFLFSFYIQFNATVHCLLTLAPQCSTFQWVLFDNSGSSNCKTMLEFDYYSPDARPNLQTFTKFVRPSNREWWAVVYHIPVLHVLEGMMDTFSKMFLSFSWNSSFLLK